MFTIVLLKEFVYLLLFTYFLFILFSYLLFTYLLIFGFMGLSCCAQASSSWVNGDSFLVAMSGLLLRGLLSCCSEWASNCGGSSCRRAQAVGRLGFTSCSSRAPENGVSSCGSWAQLSCGIWDLPGPGIKSMFPALEGEFLTTRPPEKSPKMIIM